MTDLQSPLKEDMDSNLDKLQMALDVAGIEPTIGTGADAANVIISLLRAAKDKEHDVRKQHLIDAGISAVSMIPFADVVKLIKLRKLRRPAARIARMAKDTIPELPKSYSVEEGSTLQQKPLHNLAKKIIKSIDKFFKEGSQQLEDAKFHGYKKDQWIMGDYIVDWGGNATMFLIYPSAKLNPDIKSDETSPDYISKSGGYFTTINQGEKVGVMGKIVLHLDMYIPILENYRPDVVPSSEYDIRDSKIRKKVYKNYKRELYQFAYHEAQHAVKRFVHGWEGKPGLGVKYQKYYNQPANKRGLTAYASLGDERESILAQIASEVESTIKFDKGRPEQLQTLTSTLITSPSFRRLVIGMLDADKIFQDAQSNKEFFRSFWSSDGKPKFLVDKFDPFNPNFFKYINPKYHRLFKMIMKKLVQWWRSKFPRKTFRTPLEEYYIPGFGGDAGKSKFHEPENFDSYEEGNGWVAYSGGNDWENGITACAVYFDNNREMARIWFTVNVPDGMKSDSNCSEEERNGYNEWGEKASKTWISETKKIHSVPREYFSDGKPWYKDWKECFIEALNSEAMEPYVKECGVDQTKWSSMKKETIEENGGSGMFSGNGRTASPSNLDVDRFVDDTADKEEDELLKEEMTYKDLLAVSDPNRVRRADTVNARSLRVRSIDEYEAWTFSYKSNPSNSRKKGGISPRWQGYVKFIKEDVKAGEDAQEIPCHVDCTCPDYMYRWAYNNSQVNAGKIGPDSWNKCLNRSPREDLGQGLCKHLISLEGYLRTKIHGDQQQKSNLFESGNLYERFQQFVNENKEFDVQYDNSEEDEAINEGFRKNKDWFIYDGVNEIKVVFNDGKQLSLSIDYKGNLGELKDSWRRKAASTWKKIATEFYNDSEITEVGNIRQKPWYDCFKEAMETKEMAPFQHPKNSSKITFEKKKITGYQNAPKVIIGTDPVNFTPRV